MLGSHDPFLVALSVLIAIAAAYTALDMAGRVAASVERVRLLWLIAGSFAMGIGIWSMHFIAMLAFRLPVPISYDVPLVLLSALVAIAASLFALHVSARPELGALSVGGGGVLMGVAIAGMHYLGMAALRAEVRVTYEPALVVASVLIAITASCAALWLAHKYRVADSRNAEWGKAASAIVMGGAIVGMHYTAMAAVHVAPSVSQLSAPSHLVLAGSSLAASVALSTMLVLAMALTASTIHRRVHIRMLDATRASESVLRAHQAFLRQVIDADPNLIFVKDYNGVFTLANRAVAELYGTTPQQLVGKTDADFNPNRTEVERYLHDDREVMSTQKKKLIVEETVTEPVSGLTRWFQTVKVPLVGSVGTDVQLLGVSTDITERKLLADQLRQAQKMEAIGQLTGGIAHDLNNILTVILANADLMANALPPGMDELRRDFLDLQRAANRGATTVRKLLAFSRREMLTLRPMAINRLCTDLLATLRRLLPATIHVKLEIETGLPAISADAGAIEQMVLNLATNARDAMPDGGLLVIGAMASVLDDDWCTTQGWGKPGSYVCVTVSDTGIGIDPEAQEHIFEPFFTTKPQGVGTGLGLAMVYGLMRQHDGYVDVYSEPSQGTTVRLYFPALLQGAVEGTAAVVREVRGGVETILVADDEEPIRRSATRVLERHGYRVHTACDGREALDRVHELGSAIHLVISDVVMPRMGGRELYRALRDASINVPFLYTSGYAAREVRESIELDPDVPFLHKPWAMTDLLLKVRDVLDGTS